MGLLNPRILLRQLRDKFPSDQQQSFTIPAHIRVYAIGDLHGRRDLLDDMANVIEADLRENYAAERMTVFLGDYVDRGRDGFAVIDRLAQGDFPTPILGLMGNHEAIMLDFLVNPSALPMWCEMGGVATLTSYGVEPGKPLAALDFDDVRKAFLERLPDRHRRFLTSLRLSHSVGDYFFCHAGVRPGVALKDQSDEDLLWIRDPFLASSYDYGKRVVHGHTPVHKAELLQNRINLDTGAYATGRLSCIALQGSEAKLLVARGAQLG